MHHNVSMFDAHRLPPMFPSDPLGNIPLQEKDRSLAFVLFLAKAVAMARGDSRALPVAPAKEDIPASAPEAASAVRKVGRAC